MILYTNTDCFGYAFQQKIKINCSLGYTCTSKIMSKRVTRLRCPVARHSAWISQFLSRNVAAVVRNKTVSDSIRPGTTSNVGFHKNHVTV